jgi:hypothetical protein
LYPKKYYQNINCSAVFHKYQHQSAHYIFPSVASKVVPQVAGCNFQTGNVILQPAGGVLDPEMSSCKLQGAFSGPEKPSNNLQDVFSESETLSRNLQAWFSSSETSSCRLQV